jgi:hypothetical protein
MEDPRTKYPKPPFKQQTQPWPGLASKMDPKPDHGESSYRRSGRLSGRRPDAGNNWKSSWRSKPPYRVHGVDFGQTD